MSFFGLSVKTQAWLRAERNTYLPLFEWLMLKIYSWLPLFYCFGLFVLHTLFTEFLIYFKERLEIGLWNKGIFELRIGTCELFTIIMYRLKLHSKGTPQSQCINKKNSRRIFPFLFTSQLQHWKPRLSFIRKMYTETSCPQNADKYLSVKIKRQSAQVIRTDFSRYTLAITVFKWY